MIELDVLWAFLAAEAFKLWNSRLARAALVTMCVTPLVAMAIVAALGSTASVFPEVVLLIGSSFWLLAGLTSMLLAAGSVGTEFELGTVQAAMMRRAVGETVPQRWRVVWETMLEGDLW